MKQELVETIQQETAGIMQWANALVVATLEDYQGVVSRLQDIKTIRKRWTDYWGPVKEKAHGAWKEIVAKEKQGTDICDATERMAKSKALAWQQEQERRVQEEQHRLQAIADETARREKERLEKRAAELKTPELKAEALEAAAAVQTPVVTVASPVAEVKGASTTTRQKAELTDMATLIAAATPGSIASTFLMFNEKAANSFATSTKGKVSVPGIRFYEEKSMSIGKGGNYE